MQYAEPFCYESTGLVAIRRRQWLNPIPAQHMTTNCVTKPVISIACSAYKLTSIACPLVRLDAITIETKTEIIFKFSTKWYSLHIKFPIAMISIKATSSETLSADMHVCVCVYFKSLVGASCNGAYVNSSRPWRRHIKPSHHAMCSVWWQSTSLQQSSCHLNAQKKK